MKALTMESIGKVAISEIPVPVTPSKHEVIVRTTTAILTKNDILAVNGIWGDQSGKVLGYQVCGVVEQIGSEIDEFSVGDRVVPSTMTPCFICESCQRGFNAQCTDSQGGWYYSSESDGRIAEYFKICNGDSNLIKLPPSISDECACYASEVMASGIQAATDAEIPVGGRVAVFGANPTGLMAVAGARMRCAGLVIAVEENSTYQLRLAKEYGADVTCNSSLLDPVEKIFEESDGVGVDCAIDCTGTEAGLLQAFKVTRSGGVVVSTGYKDGSSISIPIEEFGNGTTQKRLVLSQYSGGSETIRKCLRLIEYNRLNPRKLTTHTFPFEKAVDAFELLLSNEENVIVPLIEVGYA
jgi:threonine dehydrogenase-like Zn-dependent dehydrogenase